MGIRPCPPLNPDVPCECSSTFTINQIATVTVIDEIGRNVTGILVVDGSICPNCDNGESNFTFSFVDTDLSDGNQSFTFVPTSVQPFNCSTIVLGGVEYLQQTNIAVGIYTQAGQTPTVGNITFQLLESTTPGLQDRFIFGVVVGDMNAAGGDIFVPDTSLTVTDCS